MQSVKDRIIIGEPELIRSDSELDFTFDGPMVPLKNPDGSLKFLTVDLGGEKYFHKFVGTPENIMAKHEYFEMDYNGHAEFWPCGIWVMSAYKYDDGTLVGFCHREILHKIDPHFPTIYYIGLAVSYDNGDKWKYIGDIASNVCNSQNGFFSNMGGCPLFVKDGYFYIYFNDYDNNRVQRVTSARMKMDETLDCIREEKLPAVFKYSGAGEWKTDPWNETGARIIPNVGYNVDSHAKGVYCRALDRFLITMQTGGNGRLIMYISADGEHFDEHIIVDTNEQRLMQPYSFFVSTDGDCSDDMNIIGKEFYIYYPRKGTGVGYDYDYDEFYRRKVTII